MHKGGLRGGQDVWSDVERSSPLPKPPKSQVRGRTLQGMLGRNAQSVTYSLWGSNPRPMAHKTIALTTELRELRSYALQMARGPIQIDDLAILRHCPEDMLERIPRTTCDASRLRLANWWARPGGIRDIACGCKHGTCGADTICWPWLLGTHFRRASGLTLRCGS